MTNASFIDQRHEAERRLVYERRVSMERRHSIDAFKEEKDVSRKRIILLDILGSTFAVIIGILVIGATGLYGTAASALISGGVVIASLYVYVTIFRRALYSKRL